jgi:proline iminopeptidase
VLIVFSGLAFAGSDIESMLRSAVEPYETGYLKVSEIHEIFYGLCGNPKGKPVFVLHGGPGGGSSPFYLRFFDPKKFLVVFHDQRGCGQSRPHGEIRENTTQHLVEDIETLRKHLALEKIILFGGSWGTALGLAYAETYPENVSGMLFRGILTATQSEIEHLYCGGVSTYFPDVYEKALDVLDHSDSCISVDKLYRTILDGSRSRKKTFAIAWSDYEARLGELEGEDGWAANAWKHDEARRFILGLTLLESYYAANGFFLTDGELLRNADRIKDIPAILINGRYDMVCPVQNAYRLHTLLPKSELVITDRAGHSMGEETTVAALLEATTKFE